MAIHIQTRFQVLYNQVFGSGQKQPASTPMQKQWVEAIMHGALDARKFLQVKVLVDSDLSTASANNMSELSEQVILTDLTEQRNRPEM